ncbi:hypothetical protein CBR_g51128 [Chara braunii]|uniref:Uncharacterized protein n=1 Tax=Chara braunii TaxID=69332 RepID=A0A388M865_CHABU|nr:hypothetical protein CBR_g51128 [Chara braunii]|eukprot:GBG90683.1 hypothetical protein CBR_g51128 [Chara braunii]
MKYCYSDPWLSPEAAAFFSFTQWGLAANTPAANAGQSFCRFTNDSTLPATAMRKQFCCNVTSHLIDDVTQINIYKASANETGVPTTGSVIALPTANGGVTLQMHTPVFVGCAFNISWDTYKSVHDEVENYLLVVSTTKNTTGGFKGQMYDGPGEMPANGHYDRNAAGGDSSHAGHTAGAPPAGEALKNGVVNQKRLPTIATWVTVALLVAAAHLQQITL